MASITELKAACKRKDLTLIKTIIDQTPNLIREMVYDSEGNTLLMKSCLEGWDEIVKYLMSKYFSFIDINQRNEEGKSALYHAASKGNVDCVRELLSHPDIDVNLQSREGKFALFQAASKGKGDCIRELLSHPNINVNLQSKEGKSALFRAASKGNTDCVRKLLSHPNINANLQYGEWNKPVLWYCKNRECFELLLHYYPEMKEHERTMAWIWAMYNTSERGFKKVKEVMEKLSKDKLYQMGDDISMLVFIAAEKGDKDMLEYLLSSYGDVIDINIQNKDGRTPLDQATSYERRDCIDILRNLKDIDGTIRDKDGKTAREMELFVRQGDSSIEIKIKEMDFLSKQKFVRWNRSKIMLVGQGRAGKTALANNLAGIWIGDTESTIGAEMEMRVLYGGVKGGRLEKYESPMDVTEALLAEGLYSENQNNRIRTRNPETSSKSPLMDSPQVESHESQKKEMSLIVSLKPSDIKSEKVEIYYRQLWEVDTASNYKLLLVDFGGQSLFNILHGFFMSRYGIYLVVFDMELFLSSDAAGRESCRKELRFWLNSITMHTFDGSKGTAAPVAIVGTRGDKISNEEIYQNISLELKNMFGDMMIWKSLILNEDLSFFPNNNTLTENNPVSARLLRFIETSLENEDYLQRDTPILWIKIFDEMRSLQQSYLSYEEVIRISRERYQDVRESLIENEEDVEEVDRQILTEVRKMLRFLNDMGMLMWIEEKGLEDVIILDPMEYLVKPATIIICKHLATKDDPYGTIHHIAEIHGESKKVYSFDWEMMLEYGIVSEKLARDLLLRYYNYQVRSERAVDPDLADKLLLFMIKFGLMIPSFSSSISSASDIRKSYLAPSLLPCAPSILEFNRQDRKIESMLSRMQRRYDQMSESWKNIGLYFSLFCFLPQDGLSAAKSFGAYGVMSSSELSQQGFLPHSLFERMICRLIQSMCGHDTNLTMEERLVDNDLIIGFRGKVQLSYQDCEIRIIERQEENRIEVIGQSRDKDKDKEQKVFIEIYEACLDKMNQSIDECYKGLQVEPLIHLPQSSLTSTSSKEEGFITRDKVMKLLSSSDATEFKGNSADMNCVPDPLIAGAMKRNPYWSVWKKKDQTTQTPAAPPLRAEKNTHVFLSHDWGIDRSNHQRVKQISDALKSRGLVTWIDDEWIVNDIDRKIIDGIDHTECMIVFLTENYVSKVDGGNHKDYCKREFNYGFEKFGKDKILVVVLDESLKDSSKWGSTILFNLGSVLYVDMTETSSSNNSMNDLYQRILKIVYPERMVVESKTPVNDGSDTVVKS